MYMYLCVCHRYLQGMGGEMECRCVIEYSAPSRVVKEHAPKIICNGDALNHP